MSEVEDKIRDNVKCCACGGSLKYSRFINGICLNKLATWKHPTWKNILVLEKYPEDRASAILCDRCIAEKKQPKYAVEWNEDYSEVKYHKVEALKDLPPIREEDILLGEPELDFGVAR